MNKTASDMETKPKNKIHSLLRALTPGPGAWRGAAASLVVCSAVLFLSVYFLAGVHSLFNGLVNSVFAVLLAVLSFLLGSLIVEILGLIQKIPQPYRWILIGSVFLTVNLMLGAVMLVWNAAALTAYFVLTASLLGAGLGALSAGKRETGSRKVAAGFALIGGLGLCTLAAWFLWPGQSYSLPVPETRRPAHSAAGLEHPAQQGQHNVLELTYGSGTDKHRREYGADVDIPTHTVNISRMVSEAMAPVQWLRNTYWGFDLREAPLNGRVWYPEGSGPYPLVLIVHGNHAMDDFSDLGYDYLGELLAGRGYIVVSVDQNFLNAGGFLEAMVGGLRNENDARAYLLLRHLSLWHEWNETSGHPFEGLVDTDNIALIGHSRGGEAAAIAAAFNRLPSHPGNGDIRFNFGFNIQSVIAIAPSDGQFQPRRQGTELTDINYLVLQGSADSDVRSFQGAMQYDRVVFTESDRFKAAVYIHGANHGQFNTRWGRIDQPVARLFLHRGGIVPLEKQEQAAKVFISSFLDDTLRGRREYRRMFAQPLFGLNWLPDTYYVTQYLDAATTIIADFEEDMDLTTLTAAGGRAFGENFLSWREERVELGSGRLRDSVAVRLSWDGERRGVATYSLMLPDSPDAGLGAAALTFAVANVSDNGVHLDFSVLLRDRDGEEAALPLSHIDYLAPPPRYRMFKKPLGVEFAWEPVFATYTFLLSDFTAINSAFDPQDIAEIRFVFDSAEGTVYLDDIGFIQ